VVDHALCIYACVLASTLDYSQLVSCSDDVNSSVLAVRHCSRCDTTRLPRRASFSSDISWRTSLQGQSRSSQKTRRFRRRSSRSWTLWAPRVLHVCTSVPVGSACEEQTRRNLHIMSTTHHLQSCTTASISPNELRSCMMKTHSFSWPGVAKGSNPWLCSTMFWYVFVLPTYLNFSVVIKVQSIGNLT